MITWLSACSLGPKTATEANVTGRRFFVLAEKMLRSSPTRVSRPFQFLTAPSAVCFAHSTRGSLAGNLGRVAEQGPEGRRAGRGGGRARVDRVPALAEELDPNGDRDPAVALASHLVARVEGVLLGGRLAGGAGLVVERLGQGRILDRHALGNRPADRPDHAAHGAIAGRALEDDDLARRVAGPGPDRTATGLRRMGCSTDGFGLDPGARWAPGQPGLDRNKRLRANRNVVRRGPPRDLEVGHAGTVAGARFHKRAEMLPLRAEPRPASGRGPWGDAHAQWRGVRLSPQEIRSAELTGSWGSIGVDSRDSISVRDQMGETGGPEVARTRRFGRFDLPRR